MFVSHHTLKWTRTCRSHGRHPHAHTAHFLLNRHKHWVFWASHSRIPEITELARKIRRCVGYSNARLEASDNRIKVTIRMAYGFHHVDNLTALITLRCGGLDIRLPQPTI